MGNTRKGTKLKAPKAPEDQQTAKHWEELYSTWPPAKGTYHWVQTVPNKKLAIMQILTSEPTVTAQTINNEFFHLDGHKYVNLTKDIFSGPAQMASMATHAVGIAGNFTRYSHLKNTISAQFPNANVRDLSFSTLFDGNFLHRIKRYDDFCADRESRPSLISVFALQDKEHTPNIDNKQMYLLFKSKSDPDGRQLLLPSTQARSRERIPFEVS
ncbi:hypothetical protein CC86DRAFT_413378 [Ophiobolus disseminans]|uniref:Uncharacterized protein n=1 Tax=Ophiobolus disseminans TaxID=1469910 RepID=A0A6A6ZE45_9PLEO|nr:hypothetical protein CC86DRAFT_413378 [Ophiobolus disseminans]